MRESPSGDRPGFPLALLPLVRCTTDGGALRHLEHHGTERLVDGTVACHRCGCRYTVQQGILDLLGDEAISDDVSAFELTVRDSSSPIERGLPDSELAWSDHVEFAATTKRLGDLSGAIVLEFGCGPGFYTRHIERYALGAICVDFSRLALLSNAAHADPTGSVGFVRADVTRIRLEPASIDVALNTLWSNLPTRDAREHCNGRLLQALKPGGLYVLSAHHYGLRHRLKRWPDSGRYEANGVFYQTFTARALANELASFSAVDVQPVVAEPPLIMRPPRSHRQRTMVSRLADRLPLLRQFGNLLIAVARRPNAPLSEDATSSPRPSG